MVILLLCEPRSGSTNLANWFYFHKEFTTLYLPSDPKSKWYKSIPPIDYLYSTKHLFIKEDYYPHKDYSGFIGIADKLICLYRENSVEQIESWVNAKLSNNWDGNWSPTSSMYDSNQSDYFIELKKSFKESYLDKDNFKISYEELYYNNGLQRILEYLNIDGLVNVNFPYGSKYRVEVTKPKSII